MSDGSDETPDENVSFPISYIVIRFSKKVKQEALIWLVDKIRGQRSDGGAELIVHQQQLQLNEGVTLHISASKIKFLEVAEEMEFVKRDRNGQCREFTVSQLEEFLEEGMHVDDLLTVAERETIVRHELENIRALREDRHIHGYETYGLYEGQSIIQVCQRRKIISLMYPLHDRDELKKLGAKWYKRLFKEQPIEDIRLYFGEAIALYCSFLGFYTTALLVPMVLGFIQLLVSTETVPFFCVFNVVWVTVFLELWKRRSNELAFAWGTISMTSLDEPRPNYHGQMAVDPVTGRIQPQYPRWKTNVKMYCVSFPIVLVCMMMAFIVMLGIFFLEELVKNSELKDDFWAVPSVIYGILVFIMSCLYRKLATALTEWENHRTQSQFERHRVLKLVLFEFVNNFMSFFYIAFIIQDMEMLRTQLATMLVIWQVISNIQEAVLPLVLRSYKEMYTRYKAKIFKNSSHKEKYSPVNNSSTSNLPDIPVIPEDNTAVVEARKEGTMDPYEGTYDDYLEMFVQFGYVVLFSSVYPIAAFWAVLNNILEIRADAFKLCVVLQRPMTRRVKDIGVWQNAFQMIGMLSIMTNCGLLWLSPRIRSRAPDASPDTWVLYFVLLEHVLLGLRYAINKGIADKPMWVRVELARKNYESKQALKNERAQKNRRLLTRKFKTVHHRPSS